MATRKQIHAEFSALVQRIRQQPALQDMRVRWEIGQHAEFPAARDFAYCQTLGPGHYRLVFAPKILKASLNRLRGLLMHELAHAAGSMLGVPEHSERDADAFAEVLFGRRLYYDHADVQTTRLTGVNRRPGHLPQ